jgi:hypothetical protein
MLCDCVLHNLGFRRLHNFGTRRSIAVDVVAVVDAIADGIAIGFDAITIG